MTKASQRLFAKVGVEGSNPFARSNFSRYHREMSKSRRKAAFSFLTSFHARAAKKLCHGQPRNRLQWTFARP
jgi:hypothetical protein